MNRWWRIVIRGAPSAACGDLTVMKGFSPDQLIFALVLGAILLGLILYRHLTFF
jgi:hypothetical protein